MPQSSYVYNGVLTPSGPFMQVCYDRGLPTLLSLLLSESFFPLLMYFKANPETISHPYIFQRTSLNLGPFLVTAVASIN